MLRDISPPLPSISAPEEAGLRHRQTDPPYFTLPLSFPASRFVKFFLGVLTEHVRQDQTQPRDTGEHQARLRLLMTELRQGEVRRGRRGPANVFRILINVF